MNDSGESGRINYWQEDGVYEDPKPHLGYQY